MKNNYKLQRYLVKFIIFLLSFGFLNFTTADWEYKGLTNSTIGSLLVKDGILFAGTRISGVCLSTNNGDTWSGTSLNNQTIWELASFGDNILAGTFQNGVYVSGDNGATWVQTNLSFTSVHSFAALGNNILAGTSGSGIFISSDKGMTWSHYSNTLESVFTILPMGDFILASSQGFSTQGIYRSTDFGVNWVSTSFNMINVSYIRLIGNTILAGSDDFNSTNNGLYFSTDNGNDWAISSLNNNLHIDALLIDEDTIYAGTYRYGVYVSHDAGTSWVQRSEGLPNLPIPPNALSLAKLNNYIFAGIQVNGIYRRSIGELIGIQPISTEIPHEFSLSQNYPNPFNPATKIEFSVPKEARVSLRVYDIKGSLVEVLVNENVRAGKYSVNFNASKLSSGIYFYSLQTNEFSQTKKMVLVK